MAMADDQHKDQAMTDEELQAELGEQPPDREAVKDEERDQPT